MEEVNKEREKDSMKQTTKKQSWIKNAWKVYLGTKLKTRKETNGL